MMVTSGSCSSTGISLPSRCSSRDWCCWPGVRHEPPRRCPEGLSRRRNRTRSASLGRSAAPPASCAAHLGAAFRLRLRGQRRILRRPRSRPRDHESARSRCHRYRAGAAGRRLHAGLAASAPPRRRSADTSPARTPLPCRDHPVDLRAGRLRHRIRRVAGGLLGKLRLSDVLSRQAAQSRATRRTPAAVLAVAAAAWLGAMALAFALADAGAFAWHMVVHLLNITVVAPLASATTRRWRPMRMPAPLVAAFIELLVVWAWHAPAAHAFARASLGGFLFEQASFLACAFLLWTVVIDALARRDRNAMGQSVL